MEVKNPQHNQILDISRAVPAREPSLGGSKNCGAAACGFSDARTSSKDARERSASMKKLFIAVILCVIFMSAEVVGGIKANSLAILTDAAHLLSDVAAFAISLFSLWASGWEANPRQSYGFFRIEILGALVSIQLIWLLTGILVYEAIARIIHDTGEVRGSLMFFVAAFGLLVNIIMAILLGHDHDHSHGGHDHGHGEHGHGHGHAVSINTNHQRGGQGIHQSEHGHFHEVDDSEPLLDNYSMDDHGHGEHIHSHGHGHAISSIANCRHGGQDIHQSEHNHPHEVDSEPLIVDNYNVDVHRANTGQKQKRQNINVQGAYLHVLGDSIQSIGVMIGGEIIWYKPQWKIIDLICTLLFSVIVLGTTIKMLRNVLEVLMESTPREIDATMLEKGLCEMEEVVAIHELHIWAITVGKVLLACHVKIKKEADADMVLDKVIDYIRREYNISHVTIQIERD
ncbi:PREDICTED: metal tolerance protein A1-like [Nelumbo nucifera]|uniref:Metal tolerance protein A1-like n=2 Tax=Nelumbo nucifera TaxID=4432 RepID=A0A1U7ZZH6_NELNU|nr:PREDICTED: metal tolerance protein A1-like [Nelumbo nucifera]XP_010259982.1 PREDICTED: metal tolerance protein A1-like [Nelumbo nucifera]XP_010259984.1 PREDICTED: metal tolerance protein A1-like [Nelumbo nucifera]XP_019053632.1 PREDICTED: metal tolerance protein A1-like [Nelumbo nucifera]DAD27790.1 TPA_asm: hypothetical protein HUJ06_029258 [Nelumbo nucifera]